MLNVGTFTGSIGALTLTSGTIAGTTGVLTGTSYNVQTGLISATLAGASGLLQSTTGLVTLAGSDTYTGGTSISAGTVKLDSRPLCAP